MIWLKRILGLFFVSGAVYFAVTNVDVISNGQRQYSPTLGEISFTASVKDTRVIDADAIVVDGIKVRLDGISAPENDHDAYRTGRRFVDGLIRAAVTVRCELEGRKTYDREVGTCYLIMKDGSEIDPQAEAVAAGFAPDCPRYSEGRYLSFESDASRALPLPPYCQ